MVHYDTVQCEIYIYVFVDMENATAISFENKDVLIKYLKELKLSDTETDFYDFINGKFDLEIGGGALCDSCNLLFVFKSKFLSS